MSCLYNDWDASRSPSVRRQRRRGFAMQASQIMSRGKDSNPSDASSAKTERRLVQVAGF